MFDLIINDKIMFIHGYKIMIIFDDDMKLQIIIIMFDDVIKL